MWAVETWGFLQRLQHRLTSAVRVKSQEWWQKELSLGHSSAIQAGPADSTPPPPPPASHLHQGRGRQTEVFQETQPTAGSSSSSQWFCKHLISVLNHFLPKT